MAQVVFTYFFQTIFILKSYCFLFDTCEDLSKGRFKEADNNCSNNCIVYFRETEHSFQWHRHCWSSCVFLLLPRMCPKCDKCHVCFIVDHSSSSFCSSSWLCDVRKTLSWWFTFGKTMYHNVCKRTPHFTTTLHYSKQYNDHNVWPLCSVLHLSLFVNVFFLWCLNWFRKF